MQIHKLQKKIGSHPQWICWLDGDMFFTNILCKEVLPVLEVSNIFQCENITNQDGKTCLWSKLWKKTWFQFPDVMIQTFCMTLGKLFNLLVPQMRIVTSFLPLCLMVWCGLILFVTMPKKNNLGPQLYSIQEQTYFKESREKEPAKCECTIKKISGISGDKFSAK